jgi:hypothetical protein
MKSIEEYYYESCNTLGIPISENRLDDICRRLTRRRVVHDLNFIETMLATTNEVMDLNNWEEKSKATINLALVFSRTYLDVRREMYEQSARYAYSSLSKVPVEDQRLIYNIIKATGLMNEPDVDDIYEVLVSDMFMGLYLEEQNLDALSNGFREELSRNYDGSDVNSIRVSIYKHLLERDKLFFAKGTEGQTDIAKDNLKKMIDSLENRPRRRAPEYISAWGETTERFIQQVEQTNEICEEVSEQVDQAHQTMDRIRRVSRPIEYTLNRGWTSSSDVTNWSTDTSYSDGTHTVTLNYFDRE